MKICQNIQEYGRELKVMTGFLAWYISVAVAFLTMIWKLGLGTTVEARDKPVFFTVCKNMTHTCHRGRFCMHRHASCWHIYAYGREIWKSWPKPRNVIIVIVNHYFLSTYSVQALLKSEKTESKGEKYIWTILRTTEQCASWVRIFNGFLNVMMMHHATKTMTTLSTLLITSIPETSGRVTKLYFPN